MMSFHEVRLPTSISLNALGGPERRTEIVTLASGYEERNTAWADSRRRYNAGYALRSLDDVHMLIAFFEARRGRLHGFRWKDGSDFRSCPPLQTPSPLDQPIGVGDGQETSFPLTKTYISGGESYVRAIRKPVAGTVRVAAGGQELAEGPDFTLDPATGLVTLTAAPANGVAITAGYEFDVPVRFDTDKLDIDLRAFRAGELPSVPVVEIRI